MTDPDDAIAAGLAEVAELMEELAQPGANIKRSRQPPKAGSM